MSDAQGWLAKEATPIGPFVIPFEGDRIGSAVAPSHWFVIVNSKGR